MPQSVQKRSFPSESKFGEAKVTKKSCIHKAMMIFICKLAFISIIFAIFAGENLFD
jgi:hypothetical protein